MSAPICKALRRAQSAALLYFKDKPSQRPSDWCVENLRFDEDDNHGPFTFNGTEYCRELVDDFGDVTVKDSVSCFGSQSRKTGSLMGGVAWAIVNDPCGFIWAMPTVSLAQRFTLKRWIPMLEASRGLEELIEQAGQYDMKKLDQQLGASSVIFTGSNSAASLSSMPRRRTIQDEVDKFDRGGRVEANASDLIDQRTKGQFLPQRFKTSTPTLIEGLIWQEMLKGDMRRYNVPCPNCGRHHPSSRRVILAWSPQYTMLEKTGREAFVVWDKEARRADGEWDMDRVVRSARYRCPHCSTDFQDGAKTWMNREGVWIPTKKGSPGFVSRHLPSMYAPGPETTAGQLAKKFLEQKGSLLGLQGFINGDLAEPYQSQDRQSERVELITSRIESGATWNTMLTVDCQFKAPHFWFVKRAWGERETIAIAAGAVDTWDEVRAVQGSAMGFINNDINLKDDGTNHAAIEKMKEDAKQFQVRDDLVLVDSGWGARSESDVYVNCANFCEVVERPHPQLPLLMGWTPAKGFPVYKRWHDKETKLMIPFYMRGFDPFTGYPNANQVEATLFEFSGPFFKDILENLRSDRDGTKYGIKWSVAENVSCELYWRHMNGKQKVRVVTKQTGKKSDSWQLRSKHWPDHIDDCEIMQIAYGSFFGFLKMPELKTIST